MFKEIEIIYYRNFVHCEIYIVIKIQRKRTNSLSCSNFCIGDSQKCTTPEQDASSCRDFQFLAGFNAADLLKGFMGTIDNLMRGIPTEFVEAILSTLNKCDFDPTNDMTIAKSFKFILYKPWVETIYSKIDLFSIFLGIFCLFFHVVKIHCRRITQMVFSIRLQCIFSHQTIFAIGSSYFVTVMLTLSAIYCKKMFSLKGQLRILFKNKQEFGSTGIHRWNWPTKRM